VSHRVQIPRPSNTKIPYFETHYCKNMISPLLLWLSRCWYLHCSTRVQQISSHLSI
jgi:hypothetical protein